MAFHPTDHMSLVSLRELLTCSSAAHEVDPYPIAGSGSSVCYLLFLCSVKWCGRDCPRWKKRKGAVFQDEAQAGRAVGAPFLSIWWVDL